MLSNKQMTAVRGAIETMYTGVCTITEQQKIRHPNHTTGFEDVIVLENQPCQLSFSTPKSATQTESGTLVSQIIQLFLSPEIPVRSGSKVTVTQNNVTTEYQNSGKPAMFPTHQELALTLLERWA